MTKLRTYLGWQSCQKLPLKLQEFTLRTEKAFQELVQRGKYYKDKKKARGYKQDTVQTQVCKPSADLQELSRIIPCRSQ